MKYNIAGIAVIIVAILGIISMALVAIGIIKTYGLPFVSTEMVVIESVVIPEALTQAQANRIRQAQVQSGNQAIITCENGLVYVDNGIGGLVWGEVMKVKWESPVINQPDMVKTLYCLNGSIRTE
jgi:hypothetical protein